MQKKPWFIVGLILLMLVLTACNAGEALDDIWVSNIFTAKLANIGSSLQPFGNAYIQNVYSNHVYADGLDLGTISTDTGASGTGYLRGDGTTIYFDATIPVSAGGTGSSTGSITSSGNDMEFKVTGSGHYIKVDPGANGWVYIAKQTELGANNGLQYGMLQVNQSSDANNQGVAVYNSAGNRTLRIWVDSSGYCHIDSGGSANQKLILNSGGTVDFGQYTDGASSVIGYITINDAGGTPRKLAVIQ